MDDIRLIDEIIIAAGISGIVLSGSLEGGHSAINETALPRLLLRLVVQCPRL